jgi:hypothetical protein
MTNYNFEQLDSFFRKNDFPAIENDINGIRYLKLRSMSRKETIQKFCEIHQIDLSGSSSRLYFKVV